MIKLKTLDSVMIEVYDRIIVNKPFDKNLKPYTKESLEKTLKFFERKEDYEKCQVIFNFINKRFSHNKFE